MTYPTLTSKAAQTYLDAQQENPDTALSDYVVYRESDDSFDDLRAADLLNAVGAIKLKFPSSIAPKSRAASDFEAQVGPIIHSILGSKQYCADSEFWIWLAVAHFKPITRWRYGESLKLANLGIGTSTENFIYRLWLRPEVVLDLAASDPYDLAKRGSSIDFWRSHIFRTSYANWRPFARALVRYQYGAANGDAKLTTLEVRALAKRLTQVKSNQMFACLDEYEALSLIETEAQELLPLKT